MGRTKKVGTSGRFGVRYGSSIKKKLVEVELTQKKKHACPSCLKPGVRRLSKGIWFCQKCNTKFTGKAYKPV